MPSDLVSFEGFERMARKQRRVDGYYGVGMGEVGVLGTSMFLFSVLASWP
jgi:hypothetical protein